MSTVMMSGGDLGGQEHEWVESGTLPDTLDGKKVIAKDGRPYMDIDGQRYVLVTPQQAVYFGPTPS